VGAEGIKAGIEIRRYPPVLSPTRILFRNALRDGNRRTLLFRAEFFDRLGKTERIVNVSDLLMANMKRPSDAKAKSQYQYAPGRASVATCVATTFFIMTWHRPAPKPGSPAVAGAR